MKELNLQEITQKRSNLIKKRLILSEKLKNSKFIENEKECLELEKEINLTDKQIHETDFIIDRILEKLDFIEV